MLKHQPLLGFILLLLVQIPILPWYACHAFSPVVTRRTAALGNVSLRHTHHVLYTSVAAASESVLEKVRFREGRPTDLPTVEVIEEASYPEDEAASKSDLQYRQHHAAPYFRCAVVEEDDDDDNSKSKSKLVGYICSTRCREFEHESMATHVSDGRLLAIHSVVVPDEYRRKGIATAMLKDYVEHVRATNDGTIEKLVLLAKQNLLPFYENCGFRVIGPSAIVHGSEQWYDLELELELDRMAKTPTATVKAALGPATTIPTDVAVSAGVNENDNDPELQAPPPPQVKSTTASASSPQTRVMLTSEMKRILIEELGYTRKNVETMRVELGQAVIEKRTRCPAEGMPESWCDQSLVGLNFDTVESSQSAMLKKLEDESKYPLKVPLLGASVVLLGKGLSDALITIIKVNSSFMGASLTEEFMGVPVLAIDFLCVVLGISLGIWTWKTMRDDE
jgi:GNAT superfamily N-acetyltransferase